MSAKHTPTPWELFTDCGDATMIKPVGRKGEVAYIQREQFASDDEFEATVDLLFAAPDLLEALTWFNEMRSPLIEALYAAASKSEEDGGDPKYWDSLLADLRNSLHRARTAIRKATGETK